MVTALQLNGFIERNPLASHESGLKMALGWVKGNVDASEAWLGSNGLQLLSFVNNVASFRILDALPFTGTHATAWTDAITGADTPLNDLYRLKQGAGYTLQIFAGYAPASDDLPAQAIKRNLYVTQPHYVTGADAGWYFEVKTFRSPSNVTPLAARADCFWIKAIYSTQTNKGIW